MQELDLSEALDDQWVPFCPGINSNVSAQTLRLTEGRSGLYCDPGEIRF